MMSEGGCVFEKRQTLKNRIIKYVNNMSSGLFFFFWFTVPWLVTNLQSNLQNDGHSTQIHYKQLKKTSDSSRANELRSCHLKYKNDFFYDILQTEG